MPSRLQPPGYVHAMISDTFLPLAVNFTASPHQCGDVSAQASSDGSAVVVRVVNPNTTPLKVTVGMGVKASVTASTMSHPDLTAANTPAEPTKISPSSPTHIGDKGGVTATMEVEGQSYTVFVLKPE